jgi:hypothetical protein
MVAENNHGMLCNIGKENHIESRIMTYVIHIEISVDNTTAPQATACQPARMSESQMEELNPRTVHHLLLAAVTIAAKTPVFYWMASVRVSSIVKAGIGALENCNCLRVNQCKVTYVVWKSVDLCSAIFDYQGVGPLEPHFFQD